MHLFTGPGLSASCPRSVLSILFLSFLSLAFFQIPFIQLFYPKIWVSYMGTCNPSCQHAVRWYLQWTRHSFRDTFHTMPQINVHGYVCNKHNRSVSNHFLHIHTFMFLLAFRQHCVCVCVMFCEYEHCCLNLHENLCVQGPVGLTCKPPRDKQQCTYALFSTDCYSIVILAHHICNPCESIERNSSICSSISVSLSLHMNW